MTGLLSLPTELLQDIAAEVGRSSREVRCHATAKKALRLVCKQINFALEPQILSTIKLSPTHLSSQVESLATTEPKPNSASKYTTCLEIHGLYPREDSDVFSGEAAKVRSFLFPAVASLTGVHTVVWHLWAFDPEWAVLLVFDALASLPLLQDLHLNYWFVPEPSWQLQQLPHIINFSFTSGEYDRSNIIPVARFIGWIQPKLKTLTIDNRRYYSEKNIQNLSDFLSETPDSTFLNITHLNLTGLFVKLDATIIPHFRSLISLHLENIFSTEDQASGNPGSSLGNIWSSLQLEHIHLQDILTDDVQPALIEYLTSFSGLRCLTITRASRYSMSPLASDQLAIMFYERALRNHVHSLESLEIDAGYEGKWCFANHCSGIIKQCVCLTSLTLSINSKDIGEGDADDDDEDEDGNEDGVEDDGDGGEGHSYSGRGNHNAIPSLLDIRANPPVFGDGDEGNRNAIWLLLDICANLPVLRTVVLFSASPARSRGDKCGSSANLHCARMNVEIADRVESYGPITSGHAFRVFTTRAEFELRCDELGMNVRYRRISGY